MNNKIIKILITDYNKYIPDYFILVDKLNFYSINVWVKKKYVYFNFLILNYGTYVYL